MIVQVKNAIQNHMFKESFSEPVPHLEYRDSTRDLVRFIDFLDRFVQANQEIIRDHDEKVSRRKKTRRVVPDRYFREATSLMT